LITSKQFSLSGSSSFGSDEILTSHEGLFQTPAAAYIGIHHKQARGQSLRVTDPARCYYVGMNSVSRAVANLSPSGAIFAPGPVATAVWQSRRYTICQSDPILQQQALKSRSGDAKNSLPLNVSIQRNTRNRARQTAINGACAV
jgi:hypothetical protein